MSRKIGDGNGRFPFCYGQYVFAYVRSGKKITYINARNCCREFNGMPILRVNFLHGILRFYTHEKNDDANRIYLGRDYSYTSIFNARENVITSFTTISLIPYLETLLVEVCTEISGKLIWEKSFTLFFENNEDARLAALHICMHGKTLQIEKHELDDCCKPYAVDSYFNYEKNIDKISIIVVRSTVR